MIATNQGVYHHAGSSHQYAVQAQYAMTKSPDAFVNPVMLSWARQKSGFDLRGAAKRVGIDERRLEAWENGDSRPTIVQAMKMAEVYKRPLSLFYLNEPPKDFSAAMTDYRRLPGAMIEQSPALAREIRLAQIRREIVLDLADDDATGIFAGVGTVGLLEDTSRVADAIRIQLGIDWPTQQRWRDPGTALNAWKDAIERQNVLVFQTSQQGNKVSPEEARGFSINGERYPVIVLNATDSPRARSFTLIHEYAHLLLGMGGVCDTWEYATTSSDEQRIEVFCNRVAGAVLVPASLLAAHPLVRQSRSFDSWNNQEIQTLADEFTVSLEVMVRRLLDMGRVSPAFYERKRQEYIEAFQAYKRQSKETQRGHAPHHRMVMQRNGKAYTSSVFTAYYDRRLTLSDVIDHLGAKVKDVRKIEQEMFGFKG